MYYGTVKNIIVNVIFKKLQRPGLGVVLKTTAKQMRLF